MISWFTKNSVAANLLMISIIILGIFTMYKRTILEVFPEIQRDIINIQMSYRGATPVEVEEGVVIKIEEAIFDLVGIDEISSFIRRMVRK